MKFANIILFKKLGEFDDELTYQIPDALSASIKVGSFVEVSFRNQMKEGIVTGFNAELPKGLSEKQIRPVLGVLSDLNLLPRQIELARFIAEYYQTSMARALRLFLPKTIWNGTFRLPVRKFYRLLDPEASLRGEKQKVIFDHLKKNPSISLEDLNQMEGFNVTSLKSLIAKGVAEEKIEPLYKPFFIV